MGPSSQASSQVAPLARSYVGLIGNHVTRDRRGWGKRLRTEDVTVGADSVMFETNHPHPVRPQGNVPTRIDAALGDADPEVRHKVPPGEPGEALQSREAERSPAGPIHQKKQLPNLAKTQLERPIGF